MAPDLCGKEMYALAGGTYSVVDDTNYGALHVSLHWQQSDELDKAFVVHAFTHRPPLDSPRVTLDLAFDCMHPDYVEIYNTAANIDMLGICETLKIIASREADALERKYNLGLLAMALALQDVELRKISTDLMRAVTLFTTEVIQ